MTTTKKLIEMENSWADADEQTIKDVAAAAQAWAAGLAAGSVFRGSYGEACARYPDNTYLRDLFSALAPRFARVVTDNNGIVLEVILEQSNGP
jgi:hypothetical protein